MATLLDFYDRDVLDDDGEPHPLRKTDEEFFERITGILPIQVKYLNKEQMIRCLEVLVKRGLGSETLFRDHLLLKIERNIYKFNVNQYARLLRALADKQYVEDLVFWNQYVFRYIHETGRKDEVKTFTEEEARLLWDALIYLKLKCPTLDIKEHITKVESFMPREEEPLLEDQTETPEEQQEQQANA